jgi:hypothetical protein
MKMIYPKTPDKEDLKPWSIDGENALFKSVDPKRGISL